MNGRPPRRQEKKMGRAKIPEEDKKARRREYMRKYWAEHRADNNKSRKLWRENHPEESREYGRIGAARWREKNREKYNEYQREYRKRRAAIDEMNKD